MNNKRLARLAREIRAFCVKNGDPKTVERYARYFKGGVEGYDAYGVPDAKMIPAREKWLADNRDLGLGGFLALGDILFESGKFEDGMIAVFLASGFVPEFTPAAFQHAGRWLDSGVCNWAHNDVLCGRILSPCLGQGVVKLAAIAKWRKARSRWKRRAVPVTMLILLKSEKDFEPLLDFIDPLMLDKERVVHQGLGWFLREAWKQQPKPVERFLLRWKDSAARLIFQYATEKMTPAARERYRTAKRVTPSRAGRRPETLVY
jgi:3-methyladenine DNA glycosylase AlkD